MNKAKLLALAQSLGIVVDESMTIDQISELILNHKPVNQHNDTPNGDADSVFSKSNSLATETRECKLLFVAPTSNKEKARLIVTRDGGKTRDVVYVFRDVLTLSGAKPGHKLNMLIEKHHSDSKNQDYWNCTAICAVE